MEPDDVLADDVHVRGPVRVGEVVVRDVRGPSRAGQVVGQRVEPHVQHVPRSVGHGDAPVEGGAAHAQIAELVLA